MAMVKTAWKAFFKRVFGETTTPFPDFDDAVTSGKITEDIVTSHDAYDCPEIKELDRRSGKTFRERTVERFRAIKSSRSRSSKNSASKAIQENKQPSKPFPFANLPFELREAIYDQIVPDDGITYEHHLIYDFRSPSGLGHAATNLRYGILLTNKQYSAEFTQFVYLKRTFHFETLLLGTPSIRRDHRISSAVRHKIQHCKLVVDSSSMLFVIQKMGGHAFVVPSLTPELPSLRTMNVAVRHGAGGLTGTNWAPIDYFINDIRHDLVAARSTPGQCTFHFRANAGKSHGGRDTHVSDVDLGPDLHSFSVRFYRVR